MRTPAPLHVAPPDPAKKRRRVTRLSLASAIVVALGGSGVYIAAASADEVVVPGRVQAEAYAANSGAQTEGTGDKDGGKNVGWLTSGDWMRYDNVAVTGADWSARIASQNTDGGSVEIRQGSQTGTLLATFPVKPTGNWQKWTTVTAKATSVPAGKQTLFAVMKSKSRSDFVNINWFTFGPAGASTSPSSAAPGSAAPSSATPSSAAPSSAAPTATSTASAPAGGWVPVDQAAWQKELAYFNSVPLKPVPAGNTRVAEFQTNCKVSGYADDDPIVLPGMPGGSHKHTFFGPKVDAFTTNEQLLAGRSTTCDAPGDFSAYWAPTLTQNGKVVPMESFRVYYGSRLSDPSDMKPFPPGLRMVQGDAKRQEPTPAGQNGQFWCTGGEIGRSADGNWPKCGGGHLIYQLTFKDCWDGKNIDSPDHKSHMGNAVNDKCQGDYPVAVPNLSFMLNYDTLGGDGLKLASGMASSQHGDFMNAWDPEKLSDLVKICLTQKAKCGTTPTF